MFCVFSLPSKIKSNCFIPYCSASGYSNKLSFKNFCEDDLLYAEDIARSELIKRITEKCVRLKVALCENVKSIFFGNFASDTQKFKFSDDERSLIYELVTHVKDENFDAIISSKKTDIVSKLKSQTVQHWFTASENKPIMQAHKINAPSGAQNLLGQMLQAAERNSLRPKQGYRYDNYDNDYKRFLVHNRILSGPTAFKTMQINLPGCFPSISTTNRYIRRSDHVVIEGELRSEELLIYLKERNQPMWVNLSEDATKVVNSLQFDARTNEIKGFVPPTGRNGMPIPFYFKARSATEILKHFCNNTLVAQYVNTIMAKPLGNAPAFCLLIFASDNKYTADEVSNRWIYVTSELEKIGINVLCISSDSDTRFNSAMRRNSNLGTDSIYTNGLFKCGSNLKPPFYVQDYPHIGTKLRNHFLTTIEEPDRFAFGNYYIRQQHLQELMENVDKGIHQLTATSLNPADRQNFDSVLKICSDNVTNLLQQYVEGSDATVVFLKIMADQIYAFHDPNISPLDRVEKLWYSVFLVRIWRNFVLNQAGLTLGDNFLSSYSYYCIEINAHSIVFILLYLKKNNLTHLFFPHMFSSQPCEEFYRTVRSVSTVNSTMVNFSIKELLNRLSRIELLSDISNDKDSGFVHLQSLKSCKFDLKAHSENDFPSENEIITTIYACKARAVETAIKLGLVKKKNQSVESIVLCPVSKYVMRIKSNETECNEQMNDTEKVYDLENILIYSSPAHRNFANQFEGKVLDETSSYVEIYGENNVKYVFKKSYICWLFGAESYKCSSDRMYRVKNSSNPKRKKKKKTKPIKIYNAYKSYNNSLLKKRK